MAAAAEAVGAGGRAPVVAVGVGLTRRWRRFSVWGVNPAWNARLEWPAEAGARRVEIVQALDRVIEETDAKRPRSIAAQLDLGADRELHDEGRAVLILSRRLLDGPLAYEQLPTVALLCKVGMECCIQPYRRALAPVPREARPAALAEARIGLLAAFTRYAEAARAMNGVWGAVIFFDLEAPLGGA